MYFSARATSSAVGVVERHGLEPSGVEGKARNEELQELRTRIKWMKVRRMIIWEHEHDNYDVPYFNVVKLVSLIEK